MCHSPQLEYPEIRRYSSRLLRRITHHRQITRRWDTVSLALDSVHPLRLTRTYTPQLEYPDITLPCNREGPSLGHLEEKILKILNSSRGPPQLGYPHCQTSSLAGPPGPYYPGTMTWKSDFQATGPIPRSPQPLTPLIPSATGLHSTTT